MDDRLRQYGLYQVLNNLGRISATVYRAGVTDLPTQHQLCHQLFGDRGALVWHRVEAMAAEAQRSTGHVGAVVLFDDLSIASATKRALALLPADSSSQPVGADILAEALLMLNNLNEQTPLTPRFNPRTDADVRSWIYYFTVAALFHVRPDLMYALVRFHDIFLTDRPYLRDASGYLNLPELTERTTGLAPDAMWGILVAILSVFHAIDRTNANSAAAAITRPVFFTDQYNFSAPEVDSFFRLVSADAEGLRDRITTLYSPDNIRPYHVLPLMVAPLVNIGDWSVCPMLRLLVDKLTIGLYHLLLNGTEPRKRDGYLTYVGRVFEDYVDQLFRRVYSAPARAGVPRYLSEAELRAVMHTKKGSPPPVCDGLILDGDRIVLVETKVQLLSAPVRAGDDQAQFFKRVDEMLSRSAQQVDATIQHIRDGQFLALGIDPKRVRVYIPLFVNLQELPMAPIFYRFITRCLAEQDLLRGTDVRPFQLLYIGNLEQLEVALAEGQSLAAIFEEKSRDPDSVWEGFADYAWRTGKPTTKGARNPYLAARYRAIFDGSLGYLRSRAKDPADADLHLP
jgi:hypothetical protein